MPDTPPPIEHLARVFLSGFQIPVETTPEEAWAFVEAEFQRLAATLAPDEAAEFAAAVRQLIADKVYVRARRHEPRSRTPNKPPPA